MSSSLWVDKYRPINVDDIIGNNNEIALIRKWLNVFKTRKAYKGFKNCILISGPPGIGKTFTVNPQKVVRLSLSTLGFLVRLSFEVIHKLLRLGKSFLPQTKDVDTKGSKMA